MKKLHSSKLYDQGSLLLTAPVPPELRALVEREDWNEVDRLFQSLTKPKGPLFQFLNCYHHFEQIEFTIAIRDSANAHEEDGIWHDDGSRVMAASLSLTLDQNIEGGLLEIKHKSKDCYMSYKTPTFGDMVLFLTGEYGYLHKINQVKKGKRVIVAIWCS